MNFVAAFIAAMFMAFEIHAHNFDTAALCGFCALTGLYLDLRSFLAKKK